MHFTQQTQLGIATPIIIGLIIAVIVTGGGVAYLVTRDTATTEDSTTTSTATTPDVSSTFAPQSIDGVSYVAHLTGVADGLSLEATIDYDGKGNSRYAGTVDGRSVEMYALGNEQVMCTDGDCVAMTAANPPAGTSETTYSEDDIANWKANAISKGKQDCPAGSCDTWEVTKDGYTITLFVTDAQRISRMTWKNDASNFTIDLDYKAVTITRPENVMSIPGAS